jgi:hypothetical protein
MKISRRVLLSGMAITLMDSAQNSALSREFDPLNTLPPIPDKFRSLADEDDMNQEFANQLTPQGTLRPSPDEVAISNDIIAAAPTKVPPVNVAGFLLDVAAGKHGEQWRPYTRAWPIDADANPLILDFFDRTNTKPSGDRTAWCSAFVIWCIFQAHGTPYPSRFTIPPKSARSADFKSWGQPVIEYDASNSSLKTLGTPQVGDIAVFQDVDNPGFGHVAFFLNVDNRKITVLGGNQYEGHPVVHAINVKSILLSSSLQLHSVRTDAALHST